MFIPEAAAPATATGPDPVPTVDPNLASAPAPANPMAEVASMLEELRVQMEDIRRRDTVLASQHEALHEENADLRQALGIATARAPGNPTATTQARPSPGPVRSATQHGTGPKIAIPDKCGGTKNESVDEFVSKCDRIFRDYPETYDIDLLKVDFVCNLLKGEAHKFVAPYEHRDEAELPAWFVSWPLFRKRLRGRYVDRNRRETNRRKLASLYQDNKSVSEFTREFETYAAWVQDYEDRYFVDRTGTASTRTSGATCSTGRHSRTSATWRIELPKLRNSSAKH